MIWSIREHLTSAQHLRSCSSNIVHTWLDEIHYSVFVCVCVCVCERERERERERDRDRESVCV